MKPDDLYKKTLQLTLEGLKQSVDRYMPEGVTRDYFRWGLTSGSPGHEDFLNVMGITQVVQLTLKLLKGTVPNDDATLWAELLKDTVPMNVYQIYEIISDNLAIGLGSKAASDKNYEQRREVMLAFNDAMVRRIKGAPESAGELLAPVCSIAENICSCTQSLNPEKNREIFSSYLKPSDPRRDVLQNVWSGLVANIESCANLVGASKGMVMGPVMTQALIGRYRGVSSLLEDPDMAFSRRIRVGVDTILVEATLAWYMGVLGERILTSKRIDEKTRVNENAFRQVVEDGTMSEALYYTALLLRLLNDLGPILVGHGDKEKKERENVFRDLNGLCGRALVSQSLAVLLRQYATGPSGVPLTRLVKDMEHREFNVCLSGLMDTPSTQALPVFLDRLEHAAQVYAQGKERLQALTTQLQARLNGCATFGSIMLRFVEFHVQLYSQSYKEQAGEYAV